MTIPGGVGVVGIVLLVVLLVGVVAGRVRRRWSFLLAGLVTVVVLGVAATAVTDGPNDSLGDGRAGEIARLYSIVVPLVLAFVAGWLCGRAGWFRRLVVLGVAALLLAVFRYPAAGAATDELLREQGSTISR